MTWARHTCHGPCSGGHTFSLACAGRVTILSLVTATCKKHAKINCYHVGPLSHSFLSSTMLCNFHNNYNLGGPLFTTSGIVQDVFNTFNICKLQCQLIKPRNVLSIINVWNAPFPANRLPPQHSHRELFVDGVHKPRVVPPLHTVPCNVPRWTAQQLTRHVLLWYKWRDSSNGLESEVVSRSFPCFSTIVYTHGNIVKHVLDHDT